MNQNQNESKTQKVEEPREEGLGETACESKYALSVAMEHLACGKYPRQNWGQFLALVSGANVFSADEIARWDRIYSLPNSQAQEGESLS